MASIGIVRNAEQNKGQTIRVLGSRRVIVAFDPMANDIDLLRTVVQLVRTAALAASARRDVEGSRRPRRTSRPLSLLDGINKIRKAWSSVRKTFRLHRQGTTQFRRASRVTLAWRSMRWPEWRSRLLNRTPTGRWASAAAHGAA